MIEPINQWNKGNPFKNSNFALKDSQADTQTWSQLCGHCMWILSDLCCYHTNNEDKNTTHMSYYDILSGPQTYLSLLCNTLAFFIIHKVLKRGFHLRKWRQAQPIICIFVSIRVSPIHSAGSSVFLYLHLIPVCSFPILLRFSHIHHKSTTSLSW